MLQGYAILCSVTEMKDWRDAPVMKIPDVLSGAATQDRKEIDELWAGLIKTQMNYKPGVDPAHRVDLSEHFFKDTSAPINSRAPYSKRPVVFKMMGNTPLHNVCMFGDGVRQSCLSLSVTVCHCLSLSVTVCHQARGRARRSASCSHTAPRPRCTSRTSSGAHPSRRSR